MIVKHFWMFGEVKPSQLCLHRDLGGIWVSESQKAICNSLHRHPRLQICRKEDGLLHPIAPFILPSGSCFISGSPGLPFAGVSANPSSALSPAAQLW